MQRPTPGTRAKPAYCLPSAASCAPQLADFGLAKILAGRDAVLNVDGAGTLTHLAPEMLQAGSAVTTAVDAYAFGEQPLHTVQCCCGAFLGAFNSALGLSDSTPPPQPPPNHPLPTPGAGIMMYEVYTRRRAFQGERGMEVGRAKHRAVQCLAPRHSPDPSVCMTDNASLHAAPLAGMLPATVRELVSRSDTRPSFPVGAPQVFVGLAVDCWSPEPANRPSFQSVVERLEALI
jgi:serine/threonine protein kinase